MENPNAFMNALVRTIQERAADKRTRTTRITISCFDGEYDFQLTSEGMVEIEEKAGAGIGGVYAQVMRGIYHAGSEAVLLPNEGTFSRAALRAIIRAGLTGGNKCRVDGIEAPVSALRASALVERYLSPTEGGTLLEAWSLAAAVLHAAFEGVIVQPPMGGEVPSEPGEGPALSADESAPADG